MGLILPGDRPQRGGLTILVPRGYESGDAPTPVGECLLCEVQFFTEEDAQRHFRRNARKHASLAEEAKQEALEERMPVFSEESWDPEYSAHMREVGRRMLREGRLTTKPHER
jgi:hypothetical protein